MAKSRFDHIYEQAMATTSPAVCPQCKDRITCTACGTPGLYVRPNLGRAESVTRAFVDLHQLRASPEEMLADEEYRRQTLDALVREMHRFAPAELQRIIEAAQEAQTQRG